MILYAKFGEHQPLNRQSTSYARARASTSILDIGGLDGRVYRQPRVRVR